MNSTITLDQAVTMIATTGMHNTYLLRGEPGVGKSSILKMLQARFPEYHIAYVDVATLDLGDVGMPVIDRESMVTNYAPSSRFGLVKGSNKPVVIMLDELGKASRPILNMLLPLILEHRLGDVHAPLGSIVFGTTNLDTDGVGDNIPAHAYNRMTTVVVGKPSVDGWLAWASANDVAPEVCTFVKQYPACMDSYTDLSENDSNPYIFDPRRGQTRTFCSPRSLEKASNIVANRAALGDAMLPALIGTVGEAAARDMEAMVHLADQVPSYEDVIKSPAKCRLPDSAGGFFLMAFLLSGRVKEADLDAVVEYANRFKDDAFEAYTLFIYSLASNPKKVGFACKNRETARAMSELGKYF